MEAPVSVGLIDFLFILESLLIPGIPGKADKLKELSNVSRDLHVLALHYPKKLTRVEEALD